MKRILQRPPTLVVARSFRVAYEAGRHQCELQTHSDLLAEAHAHDLSVAVNEQVLELLDRRSVITPVAFAGQDSISLYGGPRWDPASLAWRDEPGFRCRCSLAGASVSLK